MAEEWDLLFTLPNLNAPADTPFVAAGYVICSGEDARLEKLASNAGNATSLKMLEQFKTPRGEEYKPACLLVRSDIPISERRVEALRAFRNVCALASVTAAHAVALDSPNFGGWRTYWTDQFLFGYFTAGQSGYVQTLDGASKGSDNKIPNQQPSAQFGRPANWSVIVDRPLLERLFRCWRRCYVQQKDRAKLRRLFRALEVAFHAGLFPADGLTSINDIGTRIGLWISAFEVLCHPGTSVGKRDVQVMLSRVPYDLNEVKAKRYKIRNQQKDLKVCLPEALYDDLYSARNQFFHGNNVTRATLHYRQSTKYVGLADIAPVLFNACLIGYLDSNKISGGIPDARKLTLENFGKYFEARAGLRRVEKAIAAAAKPMTSDG